MNTEIMDRLWEPIVIFLGLWPAAPPLVDFENGQFVIGPGSRSSAFTRDEEMHRASTWEGAIRTAALADGIKADRIERMIREAKRARREMSSPYFDADDARGPGA